MKKFLIMMVLGLVISSSSFAVTQFLVASWLENGNWMCKYTDGTVLNMGARVCPVSIGS